ncbi:serine carboxypeptidase-domain-containing protein [Paraphysoderma sedebokerense]|nr:serine carboxypeptidase-domain-containing protein [Paraphysoderma sedebokerense]
MYVLVLGRRGYIVTFSSMLRASVVFVLLAAAAALPPPESQRPLKSDFLIQSLPNLTFPETYQQYAGHLTFNETFNQRFFFWYTEKDTSTPDTPESNSLTIWFNGGPGASAMYSFFSENIGIINIFNKKKIIEINKRSWNQYTNMLYIEYPLFVGYSSAEDHLDFQNLNVESSGKMMVQFLKKWLRIFSMERTKMFLIGQSFAGRLF